MRWKEIGRSLRFGLESEYLVCSRPKMDPLWYKQLTFAELNSLIESIPLDGLPSLCGLEVEPPHRKQMPFVVEGYHLPDMDFQAKDLLPKGLEIRTPVCSSLPELLSVHQELHSRLRSASRDRGLEVVALSHHPLESEFSGPQNKRRHDYWQWSMAVMTTYGPDINLGLPREFMDTLDLKDFERKVNYYAPALAAMTVASPFVNGQPWNYSFGRTGKSYRMHKRSYIAPPIEIHPHEGNRLEFKVFDMPSSLKEIEAQFLSFIALVFSENLRGRADNQSRIYELGDVAKKGLAAEGIREKLEDFFQFAEPTLESLGFDPSALSIFHSRLETGRTPADEMLSLWEGGGMLAVLEARRELH